MSSAPENSHVPLPEALYDEPQSAARKADQPATRCAQELMRAGLDPWRHTRRRQQITAYARQVAGTAEDPELERAGIESLTDER